MEQAARGKFEIANDVKVKQTIWEVLADDQLVDAAETAFLYTREEEDALEEQQPWKTEYDARQRGEPELTAVLITSKWSRFLLWL